MVQRSGRPGLQAHEAHRGSKENRAHQASEYGAQRAPKALLV
jgi:hypothetical protein